jgi:hypothetical protein
MLKKNKISVNDIIFSLGGVLKMYLKFASGCGTETVIFIVMSLALISSVQIQRDVSVGVLTRAWTTSRMPNS